MRAAVATIVGIAALALVAYLVPWGALGPDSTPSAAEPGSRSTPVTPTPPAQGRAHVASEEDSSRGTATGRSVSPPPPVARAGVADTSTGAAITGRVLGVDGVPLPRAVLRYVLDQPAQRTQDRLVCDGNGRFSIPLGTGAQTSVVLDALGPAGGRACVRLLDVPAHGLAVGDLRLEATHELWFLVLGPEDKPLEEASVSTIEERPVVSEKGSAPGLCVLRHVGPQSDGFLVGSPGHQAQLVRPAPGVGSVDAPMVVRLLLPPALHVEVIQPRAWGSWNGRIELDLWETQPFLGPGGRKEDPPENDSRSGSSFRVRSTSRSAAEPGQPLLTLAYECKDGRCDVLGLRPESALELLLLDDLGQIVERRRVAPEQLDVREPVRIVLREDGRDLEVRVLDGSGQPVSGASVGALGARAGGRSTDGRGEVRFRPVQGSRVDLEVRKQGFAPATVLGVPLQEGSNQVDVVLEVGLSLRVAAVDPQGRPVRIANVAVREGQRGMAGSSAPAEDGSHALTGLPGRSLEVVARVGHAAHTRRHDPRRGDLVLEVPAVGGAEVVLDQDLEAPLIAVLQSAEVPGASQQVTHAAGGGTRIDLGAVVPGAYGLELRALRDGEWRTLLRRERLVVRAGETIRIPVGTATLRGD